MLSIRLSPVGKKNRHAYRIVVSEARSHRNGRGVATIGNYNPQSKKLAIDHKLLAHWQKQGAQTTEAVNKLIESA